MRKRSIILLIAAILSTAYAIYLICYFFGGTAGSSGTDQFAGAIATALATPYMIMFLIDVVFGWVGYIGKYTWAALVAAILYSAGTLLFLVYAMFSIPILIGYANQKKINKASVIIEN